MIEVNNLWKRYGGLWALRGLTFQVGAGSVFGLIGPNGAGKTTALRILATSLSPTFGDATIVGASVVWSAQDVRPRLGFMPERFALYDDLRVGEFLEFFAAAHHVPSERRAKVVDDVLQLTDLAAKKGELLSSLSKGMRQRVLLAKCLVHDPAVLLLDEPASGLDPRARVEFRSILRTLAQMGKTIVVSSHILSELGEMCDAIGIMEEGRMIVSGSLQEIERALEPVQRIEMRFLGGADAVRALVDERDDVTALEVDGQIARFDLGGAEESRADLLAHIVASGVRVADFHATRRGLEDVFLRLSKGGPT